MTDPYNLQRFLDAQDPVMRWVEEELSNGHKQTHWMWFVFPQLRELGRSERALAYGISGLAEATAYLAHPVLGSRLARCTELVLAARPRTAHEILGSPDDMKLRSCLTLFSKVPGSPGIFTDTLAAFYPGPDNQTEKILETER